MTQAPGYIIAQVVGGVLGALAIYFMAFQIGQTSPLRQGRVRLQPMALARQAHRAASA